MMLRLLHLAGALLAGGFAATTAFGLSEGPQPGILVLLLLLTAPGGILLGLPFTEALEDLRDRGARPAAVAGLGAACGALAGLIHFALLLLVLFGPKSLLDGMIFAAWLPGLAWGAAFGLACAVPFAWPKEEST